jgi:hypothetical protein
VFRGKNDTNGDLVAIKVTLCNQEGLWSSKIISWNRATTFKLGDHCFIGIGLSQYIEIVIYL